ncbi:hypothetical protein B0H66DRAFT_530740 [Apodospora peruviana]|uniref:Heterokaryon incompatibility domain-containing protein n=1 Tax=Apodospora peruviana TaxID=516989 RepID=A0AAE0IKR5_9PEZI|nr:hypothetical protein B0H66DRAFT_530740 [Apodospora peruviana]
MSQFSIQTLTPRPLLWNHWLQTCLETHTSYRSVGRNNAFVPKRLNAVEYVTLSHCWGTHQPLKLTDSNLHVFLRERLTSILPKTYKEAMEITISLGYRGTRRIGWINRRGWQQYTDKSSATLQLRGHPTVPKVTSARETHFSRPDNNSFKPVGRVSHYVGAFLRQGDFRLASQSEGVYWECAELFASEQFPNGIPEEAWNEDSLQIVRPAKSPKPRLNFYLEHENLESWYSLVEIYSKCSLSHPSDKIIAISSLAESIRDQTGDTYLAGLWKQDLHMQLCWHIYGPLDDTLGLKASIYHAPPWSCACMDFRISKDEDYLKGYGSSKDVTVSMVDILDVTVSSSDPGGLPSFSSGKLQMRAIAVPASFVDIRPNEWRARYRVPGNDQGSGSPEPGPFYFELGVLWDENIPSGGRFVQRQHWERLERQRNSELMLILVKFSFNGSVCSAQGLVLSETQEGPERKFMRVAAFSSLRRYNDNWFQATICERLGRPPGSQIRDRIDLESVHIR